MTTWTYERRSLGPPVSWRAYLPGVALISFAILVLVVPEILAALVAAMLFTAGLAALGLAWKLRHTPTYTVEAKPIEPLVDPVIEMFRRM
ncbi:MAG: hypothetical protein IPK07_14100 [Deltaproteobacteria bacterium]|nr:hypothetical protein [Deltaproteobacteria bacterium]